MSAREIVIIGGGITGLAAAYELVKGGAKPALVDPGERLGGVIQTDTVDGCVLEAGPDSFLSAKPAAVELIRELGLGSELISSNDHERVTYIVRDGRLVPMPDGLLMMIPTRILPMALSPLLSWGTKIRMGFEYLKRPPVTPMPDRSVADFIRDHYGQETVDYLAEPLLSGVYGGSAERLSVGSVLQRFVELEGQYGSLTRGVLTARKNAPPRGTAEPLFQTLKGGLSQLTSELERLIRPSTEIIRGTVDAFEAGENGYRYHARGEWFDAQQVIFACPAWRAGRILKSFDAALAGSLDAIPYSSSVTLALVYRASSCGRIPPGFGFLVPARERRAMVACTFVGAKFPFRVPPGYVVLRCFLGGADGESILDLDDEGILGAVQNELETLLGWRAEPVSWRLSRWRRSMAQYEVGHTRRIAQIEELLRRHAGLHLAGNAYSGIGIPDCIRTGRAAAQSVLRRIG